MTEQTPSSGDDGWGETQTVDYLHARFAAVSPDVNRLVADGMAAGRRARRRRTVVASAAAVAAVIVVVGGLGLAFRPGGLLSDPIVAQQVPSSQDVAPAEVFPVLGEPAGPRDSIPQQAWEEIRSNAIVRDSARMLASTNTATYYLVLGKDMWNLRPSNRSVCLLRVATVPNGMVAMSCIPTGAAARLGVYLATYSGATGISSAAWALPPGYTTVRLADGRTISVHDQLVLLPVGAIEGATADGPSVEPIDPAPRLDPEGSPPSPM